MNNEKVLLNNLILSRNNIKQKIMEMKRGEIDSDHYFRETFKPLIEPLNSIAEKNNTSITSIENTNYKNVDNVEATTVSDFISFFNTAPRLRTYDKNFGLYYDPVADQLKIGHFPVTIINDQLHIIDKYFAWTSGLWSLLCEKNPKGFTFNDVEAYFEILKSTKVHLKADGKPKANSFFKWTNIIKPLYERMKTENSLNTHQSEKVSLNKLDLSKFDKYVSSRKRSKFDENSQTSPLSNKSFEFSPPQTDKSDVAEDLIKFEKSSINSKSGFGLYKNILPNTQIVYYDDPNELVTRLNLLSSSQDAGNTGVNNEIISILEELRERNLIV